jgi:hypothetical protein
MRRAAVSGAAALTAGALTAAAAYRGLIAAAGMLLLVMAGLLIEARRWVHLAERSRVGARS